MNPEEQFANLFLIFGQLIMIFAVIERAVAQIRKMAAPMGEFHPAPFIALVVSLAICHGYDLHVIEAIVQHPARSSFFGFPLGGAVDEVVTALLGAGGPAAIHDIAKRVKNSRDKLLALKTGSA